MCKEEIVLVFLMCSELPDSGWRVSEHQKRCTGFRLPEDLLD